MMQTIVTTFYGPSNHHGAKVVAQSASGRHIVSLAWEYGVSMEQNHTMAAMALAEKAGWNGSFHGGSLDNSTYVFVTECETGRGQFTVMNEKAKAKSF